MSPNQRLMLLGLFAILLMGLAVWIVLRVRISPAERERRRRLSVNRTGRMSDGTLTDIQGETLYFSYSIQGVDYTASQDIGGLCEYIPEERNTLIGPVVLKYSTRNPANSILVCEKWSGLRTGNKASNSISTNPGSQTR